MANHFGKALSMLFIFAISSACNLLDNPTNPLPDPQTIVDPSCSDGIQNGLESDVDCGAECSPCAIGLKCTDRSDCLSDFCSQQICVEETVVEMPSCENGILDQDETEIDCGGTCAPCKVVDPQPKNTAGTWSFNTLDGWVDASQNMNGKINYELLNINNNNKLLMYSRADTWDRPKVKTAEKIYNYGRYTWRVFVPLMGVGDRATVGAFLYHDDTHELDFEAGYGRADVRQNLNAESDDMVVYMTSQANPFASTPTKIKGNRWHTFEIDLVQSNGNYQARWYINEVETKRLDLTYGSEFLFHIFCSMENLAFIGDHIPKQDNYALFDFVSFTEPKNELTFNVDLNDSGHPTIANNSIRVAANPGGVWKGDFVELNDTDGDGIYSGTISGVSPGPLLFRFYEGPAGSTGLDGDYISDVTELGCASSGASAESYKVEIGAGSDQVVNVKLGECLQQSSLRFNLDLNGAMYPTVAGNSIRIAANPGGVWQGDYVELTDDDMDGVYSGIVNNPVSGVLEFRAFEGLVDSSGWAGDFISDVSVLGCAPDESKEKNHKIDVIKGQDQVVDFTLGACLKSPSITFNLNLIGSGYPMAPTNSIRIAANPEGIWRGDYVELKDENNDGIYSGIVKNIPEGPLEFRVFEGPAGSTGWTGDFISDISALGCPESESKETNFKTEVVIGVNQIIDFELDACLGTTSLTFEVDLNGSGFPTISGNSIRISANPRNVWQGDYVELLDTDADGIYSGTATNVPVGPLWFRVFEGPTGSSGWNGEHISDVSEAGCAAEKFEGANYEVDVVEGMSRTISFVLNECY